ncbi:hypothetical protein V8G54_011432 [Vigna mungo]|uniref:Uncharacterized protein n=1 Tax=Vigna mungo TaxID=3915 RepID=A0AAQ3NS10_VIGMU
MTRICWEWFLREEDRGNPIIRATLNLDEGPIPEDDVHEFGMTREEGLMRTIEDNQRKMVEMNQELRTLAAMVGDGKEERKQPHFSEDGGTCGVDDDGEPDDGQPNDDEGDDGKAYEDVEIVRYIDAGGSMEEEKEDGEDVLDVAPLVGIVE